MEIQFEFYENGETKVAELLSRTLIHSAAEMLDIMMGAYYQGASSLIIHQGHLSGSFFDLKTGVAGDILQKFSTYRMRLAIIGKFDNFSSKSLADFIRESNKFGRINFCGNIEEARLALSK
ncbi:MAG: DUF4180 domain-containing protein [Bacteroidetes bacterium]|nr:DUF4180 domain-containing protein [Bacteroidota bacterium]